MMFKKVLNIQKHGFLKIVEKFKWFRLIPDLKLKHKSYIQVILFIRKQRRLST